MKVIFIEDVPNVARAGQTKVVADGYARNYLFPRKFAVLANSNAAAAVEVHLKKIVKQKAIEEAEMAELAKLISGTEITLKAKVGEKDHLYGSVTGADIAEELSKTIGREVDKRKVDLAEPIRQVGVYDVTIRFTHDITAVVSVTAMSDEPGAIKPQRVAKKAEEPKEKAEKKEKPPKEKKEKKEKLLKEEKEETADKAEKIEKPAKEKKEKPAKAPKTEKPEDKEGTEVKEIPQVKEVKPPKEVKAVKPPKEVKDAKEIKEVKPPKEKKTKPEKAEKEAKPIEEEKKEKKPKAEKKPRKSEAKAEDKEK